MVSLAMIPAGATFGAMVKLRAYVVGCEALVTLSRFACPRAIVGELSLPLVLADTPAEPPYLFGVGK
jgi:hypothetical protein